MDRKPRRAMIPKAGTSQSRSGLLDRIQLRWSSSRIVDGLWIGAYFQRNADEERGLERVGQALGLIKTHDPVRYHRVLHDLERVWTRMIVHSLGQFNEALSACEVDQRFVLDENTPVEQIAATIVHEATHARIARYGIGYAEPIRHRIEAICFRSEMAFANRLPNGEAIWEQAEYMLSLCESPDYWTQETFAEQYLTGVKQNLQYFGAPDVLIRMTVGLVRWRLAVSRFLRGRRREQRA